MAAKCKTGRCRNKPDGTYCSTCRSRRSRKKDPVRYAFNNLKNNAKRRNVRFSISLEDFREFCGKVQYTGLRRGRSAESYTVDRIDNSRGYEKGNLQFLKNRDNVKKYLAFDIRRKDLTRFIAA